jgi:hypothetical protein
MPCLRFLTCLSADRCGRQRLCSRRPTSTEPTRGPEEDGPGGEQTDCIAAALPGYWRAQ